MTLLTLTITSIKMYVRNKQALFWAMFFPLVIMIIFGLMNFDNSGTLNIGMINKSSSESSKEFIAQLEKIDTLAITQKDESEEKAALEKGDRDVVVVLPENFLAAPTVAVPAANPTPTSAPSPIPIEIYINNGRPQQTQAAISFLKQIFNQTEKQITQQPNLFALETKNVDSHNLRYIDFLVPGIIALSVMQLAIFSLGFTIVNYKEKGIMKRLFATPLKPMHFIISQVATRLVVTVAQISILILVAVLLFDVKIIGSIPMIFVFVILGSILFLGFGFVLAGFAKTQDAIAALANVFVLPQMFLGNVFFPLESMPAWLQKVAVHLPLNYLSDAIRQIAIQAGSWGDVQKDFIGLLLWIVVSFLAAVNLFRWREVTNQ